MREYIEIVLPRCSDACNATGLVPDLCEEFCLRRRRRALDANIPVKVETWRIGLLLRFIFGGIDEHHQCNRYNRYRK